jgi:glycosyltransferase involved in cell wall biosynthesis
LKKSKIFILPSLLEGFPLVTVEASAAGIPIIIADNTWNRTREFVDGNGIITKSDPKSLALAIDNLLKDESLILRLGKKGQEIAEDYDWDNITNEMESYYKYVTNNVRE